MKDSLRLNLVRTSFLPLSLLALSCGGGTKPPPQKDPPQATLTVPKPNTAGQKLTVMVSATGCDVIDSLSIYDREDFLKSVPYSGPGSVPVDLAINEIKYTRGIAANLSLHAHVVCTDGRQNDSQPQPATFFPAAEVVEAPSGSQLVPDYFVAEGSLPYVYFLGCGNDPSTGQPHFYRVDKNGSGLATDMSFLCTAGTVVTPKHPSTGQRWVWTPSAGAMAVDSTLTTFATVTDPIDILVVGPDGDAIIYDAGTNGSDPMLARVDHTSKGYHLKWSVPPPSLLITAPLARNDDFLVATISADGAPTGRANIIVSRIDYGQQNPATGGLVLGQYSVLQVASDNPIPTEAPPTVFSPDGSLVFIASPSSLGSTVLACPSQANDCASAPVWKTTLTAPIVSMVPYAAGTRLAAIAAQKVWFLDASTGAVTNKGGAPLSPEGGLVVLQVQSGAPPAAQAFYLLNGPPPQDNLPTPQALEIVATDDPAKGELYRYQVNAGSLSVAMDDAGTLWMRVNGDLVRPLTPAEYRQVKPVTP